MGSALNGVDFKVGDFGNQLVRGTLTGLAAGTTAAVMRGGRVSVQQIATDAFGNALGSSLAGGSFNGASQNEAVLQGAGPWSERDYVNGMDLQSDNYSRPYTGGADWATDVAMRRAGYPTYAQSAPQPYGNDEFRSSERAYRSATESSTPGTSVRAGAGASISSILGTSEPQAIGNFMRANNLTTDRLQAGGTYFVPSSADSYGDQQGLGQGALNAGNARMAARQEAAAQAASMDEANQQRWDAMQVGAWSGRTGQVSASSMGVVTGSASGSATFNDSSLLGAAAGVAASFGEMAVGAARIGSNMIMQVGDILTGGYNHNHPVMQQVWSEQQALGRGIVNAVISPRLTTTNLIEGVVNRYDNAMTQASDFDRSYELGKLFNDVGQGAVGAGAAARATVNFGASSLRSMGATDYLVSIGDAPTSIISQRGALNIHLSAIPPRSINGGVDFVDSPYLYPVGSGQKNIVTIEYTGSRRQDFGAANIEAGISTTQKPPADYTWHHLDDYNPRTNTGTLQLVRTDAHEATYPHNGGVKQYQDATGRRYR